MSVFDSGHQPVSGAAVEVNATSKPTDDAGRVTFNGLRAATYQLSVSKPGFQPLSKMSVVLSISDQKKMEVTLAPAPHRESVDVQATSEKLDPANASQNINTSAARELPGQPPTVADALPLTPGITRSPEGGLNISASGEQRSALIVNSADVTDPATGQFGTTIPIDSVETLSVLQTPFLAEYGRFTSALVSVETRRGGNKWKAEVNDPLPDFRIRSYHMMGIRDATPRLNFEGPLIKDKLFFSEGFEYVVRKTSVLTLPFPSNQKLTQGLNSFSQLDYIVSANNLLTGTFHLAPTQLESVNLNLFNPKPTVPDASLHDYTGTISDKLTLFQGDLFENTVSYTSFSAHVWAHGNQDLVITPSGDLGNYFAQQNRLSSRLGFLSTYSLHPIKAAGEHNIKAGAYFAPSAENGQIMKRPFSIEDSSGALLESVQFTGGAPVDKTDTEITIFAQDHWLITPRFAVDAGLRGESQEVSETLRVAPRAGFAWTPLGDHGPVVRGGAGLFYDRVPLDVFSFAKYPNQVTTTYDAFGNVISGPTPYLNALGTVISRDPFVYNEKVAGNFSPRSTTWSLQMEQQVGSFLKLKASFVQNVSAGLITLNPIPPIGDSTSGSMLLTGNGESRYRQFELSGRLRLPAEKQLYFSYVKSRARGDLNDFSTYLGSFPAPVIRPDEFGTLPADIPNRFLIWGLIHLPWKFRIAPIFEWRSGFPYLVTDAAQNYVGVPYGERFPNFLSLDARISKDFKVSNKYSVRFSVSSNNATNHFNPDTVYANTDASLFGQFLGQHKRRFMADFDFLF